LTSSPFSALAKIVPNSVVISRCQLGGVHTTRGGYRSPAFCPIPRCDVVLECTSGIRSMSSLPARRCHLPTSNPSTRLVRQRCGARRKGTWRGRVRPTIQRMPTGRVFCSHSQPSYADAPRPRVGSMGQAVAPRSESRVALQLRAVAGKLLAILTAATTAPIDRVTHSSFPLYPLLAGSRSSPRFRASFSQR
jgi:hypothetical protein